MTRRPKTSSRRTPAAIRDKATALLMERNTWTPAIAAEWAGIPLRTLYRLLRDGAVPCIPMGDSQTQRWPSAHDGKRKRACFKYVIPRVAFQRWFENIGKPESVGSPAA